MRPETPVKSEKLDKPAKPEKRLDGLQLQQRYPALFGSSTGENSVVSKPSAVLPDSRPAEATARGQMIPVNKDGHRLEVLCENPSLDAWKAYHVRKEAHKVCNSHHLAGRCEIGPGCDFDHTELSPLALTALRYILKKNPCRTGAECRDPTCYVGHLCQIDDCHGGSGCRFKADKHIHNLDFNVARWVEPELAPVAPVIPSSAAAAAAAESSVQNSSSPVLSYEEDGFRATALVKPNTDLINLDYL